MTLKSSLVKLTSGRQGHWIILLELLALRKTEASDIMSYGNSFTVSHKKTFQVALLSVLSLSSKA